MLGYWAIDIFSDVKNEYNEDEFILITNKSLCTLDFIKTIKPDVIFFYGWSWYVTKDITDNYMCMCLHPSSLPKYRGGSPIQNQIMNDEFESAVTIFKMGAGLDDGPIYFQQTFELTGYLDEILQKIENLGIYGTKLFIKDYKKNIYRFRKQDETEATSFKRLKPSDSEIKPDDFLNHDAKYFYNKIRGLQKPYPECYIKCKTGKIIFKNIEYDNTSDITPL